MSRGLWIWSLMAMLFLGLALGLGGARLMERSRRARLSEGRPLVGWMTRELDLTPAQRESLLVVVSRHRAWLESERRGHGRRMRSDRESLRAEIRSLLTTAQRERFDDLTRRYERRWRRYREGRGDPD